MKTEYKPGDLVRYTYADYQATTAQVIKVGRRVTIEILQHYHDGKRFVSPGQRRYVAVENIDKINP